MEYDIGRILKQCNADAFLVSKKENIAYLSGFNGEGHLLLAPARPVLIVDFRYYQQAVEQAKKTEVVCRQNFHSVDQTLFCLLKEIKIQRLAFEADVLSYHCYCRLRKSLRPVKLVPAARIVEQLRAVKSPEELGFIRQAAALAVQSIDFARKIVQPGKKETDIAREIRYFMQLQGAEDCAFDIIVASGPRSAMPHAAASPRIIKEGETVLIDLGCRSSGYNSDLTRMLFLSKIKGKTKRIYEVVAHAQQLAIAAVRAGEPAAKIDNIARQFISREGLGAFFGHALGHGVGKEIHEYPHLSPASKDMLQEGMVFTVEPAVYIPKWGGIRIEDMVLVTKTGGEVLTRER